MKHKLLALLLAAALMTAPASAAWATEDLSGGAFSGVTTDGTSLLVTDTRRNVVWKVTGSGVEPFAGQEGVPGLDGQAIGQYEDGTLDTAMFTEPWAIVPYLDGWAVSDTDANVIRYVDSTGVYTAAGSGKVGLQNDVGTLARFDGPTGLAVDEDGMLYIADTGNGAIRTLDKNGKVSTLVKGLVEPTGLCWAGGVLYVAETGRSRVCAVKDGEVAVLCGGDELDGEEYPGNYVDGPVEKARFNHPQGIAVGGDGTLYVADTGNHAVRKLANGRVTTLAVSRDTPDAPVKPRGMLLLGDTLLVTDLTAQTILKLDLAAPSYRDVAENAWYADAVAQATERGFISGVGQNQFAPERAVDRAMFVVMLAAIHQGTDGSVIIDGENTFADVASDAWYAKAVGWAAGESVVSGYGDQFMPTKAITREQLAVILYAYAASQGCDMTRRADLSGYSDADRISGYAVTAMEWAVAEGILSGMGGNTLAPQSQATRAQSVCMLLAAMEIMKI